MKSVILSEFGVAIFVCLGKKDDKEFSLPIRREPVSSVIKKSSRDNYLVYLNERSLQWIDWEKGERNKWKQYGNEIYIIISECCSGSKCSECKFSWL